MGNEIWDIYDVNRVKIGRTHVRGIPLDPGEYHVVVNVWIKNSDGLYLISRRSPEKAWPLLWECTGGSAVSGDSSLDAALREVREELGVELDPRRGRLLYEIRRDGPMLDGDFLDVWLFDHEIDIKNITLQEGETCDAKWAAPDDILTLYKSGEFVPVIDYMERLFNESGKK